MDHHFLLGITLVSFSSRRSHTENEEIKFTNFHGYVLIWMWNHKLLPRIQDSCTPAHSIGTPTLPLPLKRLKILPLIAKPFNRSSSNTSISPSSPLKIVSDSLQNVKRLVNMKCTKTFPKLFSPSGLGSSLNSRRRHVTFTVCNICTFIFQFYLIVGTVTRCKNLS
jgi:hypothetical protein